MIAFFAAFMIITFIITCVDPSKYRWIRLTCFELIYIKIFNRIEKLHFQAVFPIYLSNMLRLDTSVLLK